MSTATPWGASSHSKNGAAGRLGSLRRKFADGKLFSRGLPAEGVRRCNAAGEPAGETPHPSITTIAYYAPMPRQIDQNPNPPILLWGLISAGLLVKAAELLVRCLENEGVEAIFGIPGEENVDILAVLPDSKIRFIPTRHEQAAAFIADVYGRLTGRAGVCLTTLGPGSTNLVTGVADANMDHAPLVAISGQSATTRIHKETHQHLDLVDLFRPISKYAVQVIEPETIPEVVRKAFKRAQSEKPGVSFIDLPENVAQMEVEGKVPLKVLNPPQPIASAATIERAARIIRKAKHPLIMAGNGVIRPGGRRPAPFRGEAEHSGGQHLHGQRRRAVLPSLVARGGRASGARLRVVRFRSRRRHYLRRVRHGRVPSQPLEPDAHQANRAYRQRTGRGG